MHSATAVYFYHHPHYTRLMVHRGPPEDPNAQLEDIKLTKAETWLILDWAKEVLNSKDFRYISLRPRGWTISLPDREVQTTPLAKKGAPCHKNESRTGGN